MDLDPALPVPKPLQTAVDAGVFGWDESGPYRPTKEHVRSLTEEHAREMLGVLSDLTWLKRCASEGLDPKTGARPQSRSGRERIERIPDEAKRFRQSYEDLLAVYQEGFGEQAAGALDSYMRSLIEAEPREEQRKLF